MRYVDEDVDCGGDDLLSFYEAVVIATLDVLVGVENCLHEIDDDEQSDKFEGVFHRYAATQFVL